jgi:hypothetical protein
MTKYKQVRRILIPEPCISVPTTPTVVDISKSKQFIKDHNGDKIPFITTAIEIQLTLADQTASKHKLQIQGQASLGP